MVPVYFPVGRGVCEQPLTIGITQQTTTHVMMKVKFRKYFIASLVVLVIVESSYHQLINFGFRVCTRFSFLGMTRAVIPTRPDS